MWINGTYIIPNFYCTALYYDPFIGPTLCYQKWALKRHFILVCSIIIQHEFISEFLVMVKYFTIFQIIYLLICIWFWWHIDSQSTVNFIDRIISRKNSIRTGLSPFKLFTVEKITNNLASNMNNHWSSLSTYVYLTF